MNESIRTQRLGVVLKVLSIGYLLAFIPWITLILLNAPVLAPGSLLAPVLRFQPYNQSYESMLAAIHVVWAIMLWRASGNPIEHKSLIDFTIGANAAHGGVMLIVTPLQKAPLMAVAEGLPLLLIAAVLWWLRPGKAAAVPRM